MPAGSAAAKCLHSDVTVVISWCEAWAIGITTNRTVLSPKGAGNSAYGMGSRLPWSCVYLALHNHKPMPFWSHSELHKSKNDGPGT